MGLPKITIPIISGIIIAMGGVDMAFGLAYTGPTTSAISAEFNFTKDEATWFNVSGFAAAMVGAVIINLFISYFGKCYTCFGASVFALISWVCIFFSTSKTMVFIFRVCTGATLGFYSTISPTLICDVAPPDQKGFFGFMNQLGMSVGYLVVNIFGNIVDWRYLSLICAIPALVQVLFILFVPEPQTSMIKTSFVQVCKFPKEIIISLLLMFFLQFSGVNAVLSNLNTIITTAKLNVSTSIVAICATVAQLIATLVASFLVDRLGQKLCWTISSIGQMIAFLLLWAYQDFNLSSIVFIIGLFLEQLTFGIGTGPVPFTKTAALFKLEVRASAMAIANAFQWGVGGIVAYLWPTLQDLMGIAWSFFLFAIISLLATIFGLLVLNPSNNAEEVDEVSDNEETEEFSRRLSHAMDIPEL